MKDCPLFRGLSSEELAYAKDFFSARKKSYRKGEFINVITDKLPFFGYVLSGGVRVCMDEFDGTRVVMASVGPGESFGESLHFLQKETPVYIYASADTELLLLNASRVKERSDRPLDALLSERFASMLAERTLHMNDRIQILTKKSVRDKIVTYLSQQKNLWGKAEFDIPQNRNELAEYLAVNRSALSRELARMKETGIIDFQGNHFKLL